MGRLSERSASQITYQVKFFFDKFLKKYLILELNKFKKNFNLNIGHFNTKI